MKTHGAAPRSDAAGVKKSASQVAQLSPCGLPWQPAISVGAGTLPVEIVADMDDQVRVPVGNRLGNLGEWPGLGIVAGLVFLLPVVETAASIADDRDAADRALRKRQVLVQYRCRRRPERNSRLAGDHREGIGSRGSPRHADVEAVDDKCGTFILDDDACDESSIGAELEPRGRQGMG